MKKIRVLHLPTTVGGNPQGLSLHLNKIGMASKTWTMWQNYIGYPADKVICDSSEKRVRCEIKRIFALRYIYYSDVVFFNFGQTLFQQLPQIQYENKRLITRVLFSLYRQYASLMQKVELYLLKKNKKILLIQYQGDDARQGDYLLKHFPINTATQVESDYYSRESDALKREQIQRITKMCFKTYALNPDLLHVLPIGSEFLPYSHISLEDWSPYYTQMASRPLRIGHAPSHRGFKGTKLILASLEELKREGFEFELVLVEGRSNSEAKECYKSVDVLVDQLFAGWYGGLAVEAMALGKPVVVYIRNADLKFIPPKMAAELPVIHATPESIGSALRKILEMPRLELLDIARRSRAYVERWHDPITIAERIKKDIEKAISAR